jgi:hypothetical protein
MIAFFCTTLFQILISVLLRERYYLDKEAYIFIVTPLKDESINKEYILKLGFTKVFWIDLRNKCTELTLEFDEIVFYSLYMRFAMYLKEIICKKRILAYEGVTTFQIKLWLKGLKNKGFNYDEFIDEIWIPDVDLLIDKVYLCKCKEISIRIDEFSLDALKLLCKNLNHLFHYQYDPIKERTIFIDRYLSKNELAIILNKTTEKILTHAICNQYQILNIKKHPRDDLSLPKYEDLSFNTKIISDDVPWELIYLNAFLEPSDTMVNKYIVYNSFSAINTTFIFGTTKYSIVCIENLLDKYTNIDETFLNRKTTSEIMNRFSQKYGVSIEFENSLMGKTTKTERSDHLTDETLWKIAEDNIRQKGINILEIRAFRLQLDCVLLAIQKRSGKYFMNIDNESANISMMILDIALPQFSRTFCKDQSDFIIDCDGTFVDYSKDYFDIKDFRIIEGCWRLSKDELEIYRKLNHFQHIYIWGASKLNINTLLTLKKLHLTDKIGCVFDTYITGKIEGIPILNFCKDFVEKNSYIFVCAGLAYYEIAKILIRNGFKEYYDFGPGVGLMQSDK